MHHCFTATATTTTLNTFVPSLYILNGLCHKFSGRERCKNIPMICCTVT